MKQHFSTFSLQGMEALDLTACDNIYGGESAWYWVGYVVGAFVKAVTSGSPDNGMRLYNMALG